MAWFAGIQFALCGLSFINMLRNASVLIPYQYGTLSAAILGIVITGVSALRKRKKKDRS